MSNAFEAKHAYLPARAAAAAAASGQPHRQQQQQLSSPETISPTYKPTPQECATMTEPISYFLSQCSCYDMMGMSTQVIVLDVEAPLAVAFIAAQETRVQSCVLWDPRRREFVGVLSSTDYIKILLYCESHPEEAEEVSTWTIRHWREVKDTVVGDNDNNPNVKNTGGKVRPTAIVTCQAETSLKECLAKMMTYHVRRIVVLAEKEAASFSVVTMMDVAKIVEYLGVMFFRIEQSGGSLWHQGSGSGTGTGTGSQTGSPTLPSVSVALGGSVGSGGRSSLSSGSVNSSAASANSSARGPLGAPGNLTNDLNASSLSPSGGGGGNQRRGVPVSGGSVGVVGVNPAGTGRNPSTPNTAVLGEGVYSLGETMLPPHVSSILMQAESSEAAASEPRVGPYRSVFDIPFQNLPKGVGRHRSSRIYVTMDSRLNEALRLLLKHDIESVAVCTPERIILDVISRSDLLRMENQGVYDTSLTVREALASKMGNPIYVIYQQDTLHDIFAHFVRRRVKELFFVSPDTNKLQGQLNVTEFVFFLVFAHMKG